MKSSAVDNNPSSSSVAAVVTPLNSGEVGVPETTKKKTINLELWQACAGPLVNLPPGGTHVVYFPQGHSEQVAASMRKDADAQIPNYPNLSSKLLCILHNVTLHADPETDEVYAQMTLQPVPSFDKDALIRSDLALKTNKPPPDFFCKTLTASDTSTHGGFSVPRRAAEKIFPPLDFSMQPPAQELTAKDLHDNVWTFRHIFRGQPKRHLLTTGWSLFVSGKRLIAGDSVLFIRDEKQQLLLGIRRANRQPANLSSSVLSSDSMHIGILAAAAHAAANNSPFTVFYNPRASPSEFVIPLAKYYKAVYSNQISLGMRFRMMFETEDSGTRRYMGTITGISDLDPVRWKNSQWRNLQVGWDESNAGERRNRVSIWEIEPVTAPFFICPPPFFRSKRPRELGMPDDECSDLDGLFKRNMPWLVDDMCLKDPQSMPGLSLVQWMNMQQNPPLTNSSQANYMQSVPGSMLQNLGGADLSRQLGLSAPQLHQPNNVQFNAHRLPQQAQQLDQLPKPLPVAVNSLNSNIQPQEQLVGQTISSQLQVQAMHTQTFPHANNILQQQASLQNMQQQHQMMSQGQGQSQSHNIMQPQIYDQVNKQRVQMPDNQIQLQLLQKLQQQACLAQQSTLQIPGQDQPRQRLDMSQSIMQQQMANNNNNSQMANNNNSQMTNSNNSQMTNNNNGQMNVRYPHLLHQSKLHQQSSMLQPDIGFSSNPVSNQLCTPGTVGAGHSGITNNDVPSCSTSPSANNVIQPMINNRTHRSATIGEDMNHFHALETVTSNTNQIKSLQQKSDVKPSVNISKQGLFSPQTYLNVQQSDYLDTSSSTSVCLSQNDVSFRHQNNNSLPQTMLSHNGEVQADPRNNVTYGSSNVDGQLGIPMNPDALSTKGIVGLEKDHFSNNLSSGGIIGNYENSKDAQPELSSSFGVPDMTFNSIDSTIDNSSSFLNRGSWAPAPTPAPQFQRLRTYTKVYKRGAVGRSIDITRYSGYDELKQDLARRFGIEGQLEDRHRVGWKLVYVDHENDVLLVGDDPWEEFVNCVRYIKILSPQEVQQLSLDGDFGNSVMPNQACSSSDNGNV